MTAGNLVAALVLGLIVFAATMFGLRARAVRRLRRRLAAHVPTEQAGAGKRPVARMRSAFSGVVKATESALGGARIWGKLVAALERADSPLRPGEFFYVVLGSGLLLSFFFVLVGVPTAFVLVTFPLGGLLPCVIVNLKAARRQKRFDEQLPDLLMTMAASLRVGHTFRQSMQSVVHQGLEPAKKEFGRALLETDLGRPLDRALAEMAKRLGSSNFDYVINVVTIQREVGGSLADLFDSVSETVRQRQQFTQKVKALTAMGRMSSYILVAMPFVAVGGLSLIHYPYMAPLFTTSTGRILIFVSLGGIVIGSLILRKIVSFRMS
ncbi:MAG TPA: type II secretion system F family protein [Gaiellaceae bacterium]